MITCDDGAEEPVAERLLTAEEVGQILGVSARMVLNLPIRQIRIGNRLIRFRLREVYGYVGIENPNCDGPNE